MTQNSTNKITTNQSTGTTETVKGGNLGNSNANILKAEGGPRKWILYQVGAKDPLLGFVHASSEAEALDRLAGFKLPIIAVPANAPAIDANGMTPERIAKHYQLFGSIIPAQAEDVSHRRTSYFHRKQAIAWARMAREWWPTQSFADLCKRLAKRYLTLYRESKAAA